MGCPMDLEKDRNEEDEDQKTRIAAMTVTRMVSVLATALKPYR